MSGGTMGLQADYMFKPQWVLEAATSFFLNQGGKLSYSTGGNFWPESELKVPKYNHGPKPIPDGSVMEYNMKFWSVSLGIKKMFNSRREARTFVELPTLYFSKPEGRCGTKRSLQKMKTLLMTSIVFNLDLAPE